MAATGQVLISYLPSHGWIGIISFALSFAVLLLLMRSLEETGLTRIESRLLDAIAAHMKRIPGLGLLASGLAASLVATSCSQSLDASVRGWPSFAFWIAGVLALVAFVVTEAVRARPAQGVSRVEIGGLVGITGIAFLLRFLGLSDTPYPISGDEAAVGLEGMRILAGTSADMFRTGWSLQPYLSFLGPAVSMSVFGETLVGLRLFPALVGTFTVPVLYFTVRSLLGRRVATLAAALLAAMAFHIHFSRIAVNNIDAAFLSCAVVGLLYVAATSRRPHWFVMAGITTGLGLFSFAGARLVFVIAFLFLSYAFATDRDFRRGWPNLLLFALAIVVVVLPTAVHFLQHPDVGFGRLKQMGVFQTGWLVQEAARSGHSAVFVLGRQLLQSFAIFVSEPAFSGFYNSPKPLLDPLWSIVFVLGLFFSWIHLSDLRHVLLNIWFWSVLIFGGALILPPPAAERFLLAAPAIAAFGALGLWNIWSLVARASGVGAVTRIGSAIAASLLAVSSLVFYFREYTPRYYFTDVNGEVGTELGRYLAQPPRVGYVYFTGLPRMWYRSLPSTDFLSGAIPGEDFPTGTVPDIRGKKHPILFVFLPHLQSDLAAVQRAYPGGKLRVVARRPRPEEPLFFLYRLD